jgi:hypothetical protein
LREFERKSSNTRAFASLRDSLHLLDDSPAENQGEEVERLELRTLIARLEAIVLEQRAS